MDGGVRVGKKLVEPGKEVLTTDDSGGGKKGGESQRLEMVQKAAEGGRGGERKWELGKFKESYVRGLGEIRTVKEGRIK